MTSSCTLTGRLWSLTHGIWTWALRLLAAGFSRGRVGRA